MEQAIDIGKTSNPMPVLMDAAALAAGGRGDPTGFVIHQMSAHPELAPRLKDFIVDPPPCMSFSFINPSRSTPSAACNVSVRRCVSVRRSAGRCISYLKKKRL